MVKNEKSKHQARILRKKGRSINEICRRLNRSKGLVWYWVHDIILSNRQKLELKGRANKAQKCGTKKIIQNRKDRWKIFCHKAETQYKVLSHNPNFMLGLGLYIGEGIKNSDNVAGFSNSNPSVIVKALEFFSLIKVPKEKIKASIHLHRQQNIKKAEKFWSRYLKIPQSRFNKTSVSISKRSKQTKGNILPYGTCHITINSTEFCQKIKRWMDLVLIKKP